MPTLKNKLIRLIKDQGPITVETYMNLCLSDREAGYYMTREPFGSKGDFITAPEVSQMFGELIGIWIAQTWQSLGAPKHCTICEIGPGRGTLMHDLLRAAQKAAPHLITNTTVAMIETSDRLTKLQQEKLAAYKEQIIWSKDISKLDRLDTSSQEPLILVANELFDALPSQQYILKNGKFVERLVSVTNADQPELCFIIGEREADPALLAPTHLGAMQHKPVGSDEVIIELSPARNALMQQIAQRIASRGGAALIIDYGSLQSGYGDSLQALSNHQYQNIFTAPGLADITTHVDFAALEGVSRDAGCSTATLHQGDFLLRMGLLERAGQLGFGKAPALQEQIRQDVERLAAPEQMGDLFKVLCVYSPETAPYPFNTNVPSQ